MEYSIKVVTRSQDNGDGSRTVYCYNSTEEMLADHPLANNGVISRKNKKLILSHEDPYENGCIDSETIYSG